MHWGSEKAPNLCDVIEEWMVWLTGLSKFDLGETYTQNQTQTYNRPQDPTLQIKIDSYELQLYS